MMELLQQDLHLIVGFVLIVTVLLVLDLYFVGRNPHKVSMKEAGIWSGVFVLVSLAFSLFVSYELGKEAQGEFLAAYIIEKMLSVDNLFVFILVFKFFKTPDSAQHKVLFYGVLGAIIMRFIFIFLGIGLVELTYISIGAYHVNWLLAAFGLFLAYMGLSSMFSKDDSDDSTDYSKSLGAKLIRKMFPKMTSSYHGDKFFVKLKGIKYATPLLVVVGVVEFTDLLFAVDSIPAIFSVSKDPFILFTSNIFAILGLRSMYFLLNGAKDLFKYLDKGVSVILVFIGGKMLVEPILHVTSTTSLIIIGGVLACSISLSLIKK